MSGFMKPLFGTICWLVLANAAPAGAVVAIAQSPAPQVRIAAHAPVHDVLARAVTAPATLLTICLGLGFAALMMRSARQPRTVAF